ncbi:MAG: 3,4-dihydroxy-2-butanone-4-phosphate synthase, partial [Lentisphaeraceae bacterium]|nr:3,4-dihydroxy-2-butanone-4-phosphate synthase [Lentisphaeraceae bacterium]
DIVSPGHIYPVETEDGGCLVRPFLSDAAKDLVRLSETGEMAVICDILNDQGDFADEVGLEKLADELELNICSIHDLVEYRFTREPLVERLNTVDMPTEYGNFRLHVYKARFDHSRGIDLALTFGTDTFDEDDIPLVRVHSEWSIANIVNRLSFDEGSFLNRAMKKVSECGGVGAIIFLRNTPEQHANSLFHTEKKPTDIWVEDGRVKTLCPMGDKMSYGFGAQILRDLGVRRMNILTNKEAHFEGIDKYGLEILEQIHF